MALWPSFDDRLHFPEEILRAFSPWFSPSAARGPSVFPPVNIYDDGQAFRVMAELPGIEREALDVSVKGDQLTLRGERKIRAADAKASYHRKECEEGQFRRVVTLPQPVDAQAISATYRNGVLEVVLPRAKEAQPRKISIQ